MRSVSVRFYFGFFAAAFFSYMTAAGGEVTAALICCFLHELGHLSVMCLLSRAPEKICFYAGGIKIIPRRGDINTRAADAAVLSAGCAVNFLIAFVSRALGLTRLFEINLALGIFNLMPFSYFDGGRLLSLFAPEGVRKFFSFISALLLASAMIASGGISPSVAAALAFAAVSELFM